MTLVLYNPELDEIGYAFQHKGNWRLYLNEWDFPYAIIQKIEIFKENGWEVIGEL